MNDNKRDNIVKLSDHRHYSHEDILESIENCAGFVIFTVDLDGRVSAFTTLERLPDIQKIIDAGELALVDALDE